MMKKATYRTISRIITILLCAAMLFSMTAMAAAEAELFANSANVVTNYENTLIDSDDISQDGNAKDDDIDDKSNESCLDEDGTAFLPVILPLAMSTLGDAGTYIIDINPDIKQEGDEGWEFDDETDTYTITSDVMVVGENDGGHALTFDILNGSIVTWAAHYGGDSRDDDYALLYIKGNGVFSIAEDGLISLNGAGTAIRTEKNIELVVSGTVYAECYEDRSIAIKSSGSVLITDYGYVEINSPVGGAAIYSEGDVTIAGDSMVMAHGACSAAILSENAVQINVIGYSSVWGDSSGILAKEAAVMVGEYASVYIGGALSFAEGQLWGNAIMAKDVTIQDRVIVQAFNGAAVLYSGELNVSGGWLIGYGDGIGGAAFSIEDTKESEPPHILNVIFKAASLSFEAGGKYADSSDYKTSFSGDGIAAAWDYAAWYAADKPRYDRGDTTDLFVCSAQDVDFGWEGVNLDFWFNYGKNSDSYYFMPFDEDRVLVPNNPDSGGSNVIDIGQLLKSESGDGWNFDYDRDTFTITGDVTVAGQDYWGRALTFDIVNSSTVTWTAIYYGASCGEYGLINVTGDGTFEVTGDAEISLASAGTALRTGKNIALILSGSSSVEVYDWRGYCIAIKAEGNIIVTDESYIASVGTAGSAGVCASGDVMVTGEGYISAGIGIFSEHDIQIEISGNSIIYGDDGAVFAKKANVTVSENAQISVKTPLSYKDGELYGNAVTAKDVTIRDSAMVRALNGAAVFYTGELDISGGMVAAYGDGVGGAVFSVDGLDGAELPHLLNVVYKFDYDSVKDGYEYADTSGLESVFSGEGVALAWNYIAYYNAEIPREYSKDDKTDLIVYPAEDVDFGWDYVDMHFWVVYGKSKYVFNFMTFDSDRPLIPNHPVPDPGGEPAAPNEIDIRKLTDSASGEGWEFNSEIDTYTITGDVTVVGENGYGRALVFNIFDGSTVTWTADYRGESKGGEFTLVDVRGSGDFVVDGGDITLTGPGVAVKTESGIALEVCNYGNVSAFSEEETDICTAINAGGSVLLTDRAQASVNSVAFGAAINACGDVTIENSSVVAGGDFSVAIRSDSDISITITGNTCQVHGYGGAILAREATVTVGDYAVVRARGALKFWDGALYGNAILAKNISVQDFAHVTALNGAAVLYTGELDINGGLVAAYGDGIGGAVFSIDADGAPEIYHMLNVIFKAEDLTFRAGGEYKDDSKPETCISGDAIALAWDYSAWCSANKPSYYQDEKTDIISYPENAGFGWGARTPRFWYSCGENSDTSEFGITDIDKPLRPNPKRDPSLDSDDDTKPDKDTNPNDNTNPSSNISPDDNIEPEDNPNAGDSIKPGENTNPGSDINPNDNINPGDSADQDGKTKPDTNADPVESPDLGANTDADGDTGPGDAPSGLPIAVAHTPSAPDKDVTGTSADSNTDAPKAGGVVITGLQTDAGGFYFNLDSGDMKFTIDLPFEAFLELWLDGKLLQRGKDYEASRGSTILAVVADCLKQLEEGEHTLQAVFDDQTVDIVFTLTKTPTARQAVDEVTPEVPPLSQTYTQETDMPEGNNSLPVAVGIVAILLTAAAVFWRKKPTRRA